MYTHCLSTPWLGLTSCLDLAFHAVDPVLPTKAFGESYLSPTVPAAFVFRLQLSFGSRLTHDMMPHLDQMLMAVLHCFKVVPTVPRCPGPLESGPGPHDGGPSTLEAKSISSSSCLPQAISLLKPRSASGKATRISACQ